MTSAPSLNCMRQSIKMHFCLHFTNTPLFASAVSIKDYRVLCIQKVLASGPINGKWYFVTKIVLTDCEKKLS